jgi:hypothetical protein
VKSSALFLLTSQLASPPYFSVSCFFCWRGASSAESLTLLARPLQSRSASSRRRPDLGRGFSGHSWSSLQWLWSCGAELAALWSSRRVAWLVLGWCLVLAACRGPVFGVGAACLRGSCFAPVWVPVGGRVGPWLFSWFGSGCVCLPALLWCALVALLPSPAQKQSRSFPLASYRRLWSSRRARVQAGRSASPPPVRLGRAPHSRVGGSSAAAAVSAVQPSLSRAAQPPPCSLSLLASLPSSPSISHVWAAATPQGGASTPPGVVHVPPCSLAGVPTPHSCPVCPAASVCPFPPTGPRPGGCRLGHGPRPAAPSVA